MKKGICLADAFFNEAVRVNSEEVGDGLDRPAEIEYTNGRVKTVPKIFV